MADRHTLSMVEWHDDGTSASAVWTISAEERELVTALLGRRSDVEGLMTAEQADEARRVTSRWVAFEKSTPRDQRHT
jgi:hypothetical protein